MLIVLVSLSITILTQFEIIRKIGRTLVEISALASMYIHGYVCVGFLVATQVTKSN